MMIRYLPSPLLTLLLILFMSGYLVQGKFVSGSLHPAVMISLACILTAQSLWAVIFRFFLLRGKISLMQDFSKKKSGTLFNGTFEEAFRLFSHNGFSHAGSMHDEEGQWACFIKRIKVPAVLEILIYAALVFILLTGIMNYGFGVGGQIKVSPGGEMIDMGVVSLDRGFFAEQFSPSFKIRASRITDTASENPSSVVLEVSDKKSGKLTTHRMRAGQSITVDRLRMDYRGDAYTAFISIYKGRHDYRPVPIRFESRTGVSGGIYNAPVYIREPGTRGEGEFDIISRKLRIRVYRGETLEFDGELLSGEKAEQGDMKVQFTSLMHYGIIDISRYGYRSYVLGGMGALVLFLGLRIFFRPERACLWSDKGRVFYYARNRSVRSFLKKG